MKKLRKLNKRELRECEFMTEEFLHSPILETAFLILKNKNLREEMFKNNPKFLTRISDVMKCPEEHYGKTIEPLVLYVGWKVIIQVCLHENSSELLKLCARKRKGRNNVR